MKRFIKNHAGFTLVELMIVIAIISVLAVALFPSFQGYLARAHDTETRTKMGQFARALENYMIDKDTWLIP
jgi:prepilin-type N-terminal cleavage/methylation domain-containing protein